MGHKVNSTSLRLRNNWDSFWFTDSKKIKKEWVFQDLAIKNYIERILLTQNSFLVGFNVLRNSASCIVFFKFYTWKNRTSRLINAKAKKTKKLMRLQKYRNLVPITFLKKHISKKLNQFFPANTFFIKSKEVKYGLKRVNAGLLRFKHYNSFKDIYRFVGASFNTLSVDLLALGISKFLSLTPRHNYLLLLIKNIAFYFFKRNLKNSRIKGFKIEVNGKLNGSDRTKKKIISKGALPLSSINSNIVYKYVESHTRYGVFGIKVWFFLYNNVFYTNRIINFTKFLTKN